MGVEVAAMATKPAVLPTSRATEIEVAMDCASSNQVLFPDPEGVREYLTRFPDVIEVLRLACEGTAKRLGGGAELSLELYRDPEVEDEYLTLQVRQEEYDEDIVDKIDELWAEYAEALSRASGWLSVSTDFQPPRKP